MRMQVLKMLLLCIPLLAGAAAQAQSHNEQACVILLHGLARTEKAMSVLETALNESGYLVVNVSYPSREFSIEELAELAVGEGLEGCGPDDAGDVNFVTHSLGGILVRQYMSLHELPRLKRVVMLGPPNQGSQVVDNLADFPGFEWLNGPAGLQLRTGDENLPAALGAVQFDTGIIAGNRSINPVLSQFLPNPDDGKVSVSSTRVEGMCAFVELPVSHALMMRNATVIAEVQHFLSEGDFASEQAENGLCAADQA